MPYEYTPPKYAQVIDELRRRIESGEYPPGSLLPSEHQLSDEFQIARPTVVRALRVLRQDGWIETQQGKGSFVRGRPALAGLESQRTGEEALNRDESREPGEVIEAAITAPAGPGGRAARRRPGRARCWPGGWSIRQDGEASELVTWWVPAALAEGTDLARPSRCMAGSAGTCPGARASAWITSWSRSPPGTPPPRKPGSWASASRRRCWRCTWPPGTPRASRCWSWRWSCPVTGTSSRTPTRSAETGPDSLSLTT